MCSGSRRGQASATEPAACRQSYKFCATGISLWWRSASAKGKYHQIKRMFGALDRKVLWLKRVSMGSLELDENLKEGECRLLQDGETALVFR